MNWPKRRLGKARRTTCLGAVLLLFRLGKVLGPNAKYLSGVDTQGGAVLGRFLLTLSFPKESL